ncbi:MAG: ABC transporter ATP-binding protein [Clostridiales bacterium]|nr:ABC transporter ATP-binding protein [Clostridiales bacterium]
MIEIKEISLDYGTFKALDQVSLQIADGSVCGLIGSNGSGKSTLLRVMCGVFKPKNGSICYDARPVYENDEVKSQIVYLSDEQYYFPHCTMEDMAQFYASVYKGFSYEHFYALAKKFGLSVDRKINTFSKGMTKQASIVLALACDTRYLLCDETFDGLDPVIRQSVKAILMSEVADRGLTVVIASHNLRELEDICDHIALLHKGKTVLDKDIYEAKTAVHKIQTVLPSGASLSGMKVVRREDRGSLSTMIIKGAKNEIESYFAMMNPKFFEIIPLTLEEIFITEMEEAGYEVTENF